MHVENNHRTVSAGQKSGPASNRTSIKGPEFKASQWQTTPAADRVGPTRSKGVAAARKEEIRALHQNTGNKPIVHVAWSLAYLGMMAASAYAWLHWHWAAIAACWLIAGHIGHSKLIAFHEASHGTLHPQRFINELQGIAIGTILMVPLSVYRYVHGQHHAYLGTERDLELWPFVNRGVSRPWRLFAAFCELCFGLIQTPILFARGVLVGTNLPAAQRKRIIWEYAICVVAWSVALTVVHLNGWWTVFLAGYLAPAAIAGNLQSIRKYTEHVGLLGDSILTMTRTVVDNGTIGHALSESMLHIDYHGTHHRYAKVPYYNLPEATPYVFNEGVPYIPIFPNYAAAMWDMFRSLGNPRVGAHWLEDEPKLRIATPHSRHRQTAA